MNIKKMHAILAIAGLATANACHADAGEYQFKVLQSLGGAYAEALAINDSGLVVGSSLTANGSTHASLWRASTVVDLGTIGGASSVARAINNSGLVVGSSEVSNGSTRAVLWSGNTATALPAIGGVNSVATGINDLGVVVGYADAASPPFNAPPRPIAWNAVGAVDLGTLGGVNGNAFAINNSGQIVGGSSVSGYGYAQATLWNGSMTSNLSTSNQLATGAFAINANGTIVGLSQDRTGGNYYATKWEGNSLVHLAELAAGRPSYAYGINDLGLIVGFTDGVFGYRATLWKGTEVIDLNSFLSAEQVQGGWVIRTANDINNLGQIVGTAFNTNTLTISAFLLSPVPEPVTALLFGLGLLMMVARPRRSDRDLTS